MYINVHVFVYMHVFTSTVYKGFKLYFLETATSKVLGNLSTHGSWVTMVFG